MKLIRRLYNYHKLPKGCVATIGNFDGVHLGHQSILNRLIQVSKKTRLPSVVILFEPYPQEFFCAQDCPPRLTRLREKLDLLKQYAIDQIIIMKFNRQIAQLSAEQFTQDILVNQLNIKHLIIGDDFRFGSNREGDYHYLRPLGDRFHFAVEDSKTLTIPPSNRRISSTWIRELLEKNDFKMAEKLLGRPYSMCGRVVHGEKRGRSFGFPTANIYLHRMKAPVEGVFAVKVYGVSKQPLNGVANLGKRPTVCGKQKLLEVYLFDFDEDIYGRMVRIEFVKKIRDERTFESFELLKEQIQRDVNVANEIVSGGVLSRRI